MTLLFLFSFNEYAFMDLLGVREFKVSPVCFCHSAGRHVSLEPLRSISINSCKSQAPAPTSTPGVHSISALLEERVLAALTCTHVVVNDSFVSCDPPPEQLVALLTQLRAVRYLRSALWTHAHRHFSALSKTASSASLWSATATATANARVPAASGSSDASVLSSIAEQPSAAASRCALDADAAASLEERVARLESAVDERLFDASRVRAVRTAWVWLSVNMGAAADELSHPFAPPSSPLDRLVSRRAYALCQRLLSTIRDAFHLKNCGANGAQPSNGPESKATTTATVQSSSSNGPTRNKPDNLLVQQLAGWVSEAYASVCVSVKESKANVEVTDAESTANGRRSQEQVRRSKSKAIGSREVRRNIREMISENEPHARTSLARAAATAQSTLNFEPDLDLSCCSSIVGMLSLSRISQISNIARTPDRTATALVDVDINASVGTNNSGLAKSKLGPLRHSVDNLNAADVDAVSSASRSLENLADHSNNGSSGGVAKAKAKNSKSQRKRSHVIARASAFAGVPDADIENVPPSKSSSSETTSNSVEPPAASTPQQREAASRAPLSASQVPDGGSAPAASATSTAATSNSTSNSCRIPSGGRPAAITSTDTIGKLGPQLPPLVSSVQPYDTNEAPQSHRSLQFSGSDSRIQGFQQTALAQKAATGAGSRRSSAPKEEAAAAAKALEKELENEKSSKRKHIAVEFLNSETRYVDQMKGLIEVSQHYKCSTRNCWQCLENTLSVQRTKLLGAVNRKTLHYCIFHDSSGNDYLY